MFWAWAEKRLVFFPEPEISTTPDQVGLEYEDVFVTSADGSVLHGWFVPAPRWMAGSRAQTWLWFHGNGGNVGTRVGQLERAHRLLGVNQFIFDYRGYGRSEGRPTERGTYQDARAALAYLKQRPGLNPDRIVYFGHSLGTAVAVELAVAHPPLGLALVGPFSSIQDMARLTIGVPFCGWFVRGRYNSTHRVSRVHAPLLILHGELDEIVPHALGMKLYQAANRPKRFVTLYGASHNNAVHVAGDAMASALVEFRDGIMGGDVARGYTPLMISL